MIKLATLKGFRAFLQNSSPELVGKIYKNIDSELTRLAGRRVLFNVLHGKTPFSKANTDSITERMRRIQKITDSKKLDNILQNKKLSREKLHFENIARDIFNQTKNLKDFGQVPSSNITRLGEKSPNEKSVPNEVITRLSRIIKKSA